MNELEQELVHIRIEDEGVRVTTDFNFGKSPRMFVEHMVQTVGSGFTVRIGTIVFVELKDKYCEDSNPLMVGISIPEFIELCHSGEVLLGAFKKEDVIAFQAEQEELELEVEEVDSDMIN